MNNNNNNNQDIIDLSTNCQDTNTNNKTTPNSMKKSMIPPININKVQSKTPSMIPAKLTNISHHNNNHNSTQIYISQPNRMNFISPSVSSSNQIFLSLINTLPDLGIRKVEAIHIFIFCHIHSIFF